GTDTRGSLLAAAHAHDAKVTPIVDPADDVGHAKINLVVAGLVHRSPHSSPLPPGSLRARWLPSFLRVVSGRPASRRRFRSSRLVSSSGIDRWRPTVSEFCHSTPLNTVESSVPSSNACLGRSL